MSVESMSESTSVEAFEEHRPLLVSITYRMLGSLAEAEDVVQEAWLRWDRTDQTAIANSRAFLVRMTTRIAIDRLRQLKARRESYIGPWLPEPVLTERDVAEDVELAESVSLALLVVLETLSPLERAVFVLREAFSHSYAEIGAIIGRNEATVRQLARRARDHVAEGRARFDADQTTRQRVTEQFLAACNNGDLNALMAVLAPGVTLYADSGGRVRAPRRPVVGADKVARFFLAVWTNRIPIGSGWRRGPTWRSDWRGSTTVPASSPPPMASLLARSCWRSPTASFRASTSSPTPTSWLVCAGSCRHRTSSTAAALPHSPAPSPWAMSRFGGAAAS